MTAKTVLISGIGSGSLGLELLKCLLSDPEFRIYGADSNPDALGHSNKEFFQTFATCADEEGQYIEDLISICQENTISFLVPGSEVTNKLISSNQQTFRDRGILPLVNSARVYEICSDKAACSEFLANHGIPTAKAFEVPVSGIADFDLFPCVVKPVRDSGASNLVFLAEDSSEADFFVRYIAARGSQACVQEYIDGAEFTVGVMSDQKGEVISSVALKRDLSSKLSRSLRYGNRIISSGWSQGDIDSYPEVCLQSQAIAEALGSTWALNIQGRLKAGVFYPFEINPRHSGTSYFRALSGVNEILLGINSLLRRDRGVINLKPAVYYRVLGERHVYKSPGAT